MQFPLSYADIYLWITINAIILLTSSELLSSYTRMALAIEKKMLRRAALVLGIIFTLMTIIQAYQKLVVM